jgi:hypothetical protein
MDVGPGGGSGIGPRLNPWIVQGQFGQFTGDLNQEKSDFCTRRDANLSLGYRVPCALDHSDKCPSC